MVGEHSGQKVMGKTLGSTCERAMVEDLGRPHRQRAMAGIEVAFSNF